MQYRKRKQNKTHKKNANSFRFLPRQNTCFSLRFHHYIIISLCAKTNTQTRTRKEEERKSETNNHLDTRKCLEPYRKYGLFNIQRETSKKLTMFTDFAIHRQSNTVYRNINLQFSCYCSMKVCLIFLSKFSVFQFLSRYFRTDMTGPLTLQEHSTNMKADLVTLKANFGLVSANAFVTIICNLVL